MKHGMFVVLAAALTAVSASAAGSRTVGSGNVTTDSRPVSDIQSVDLAGSGDLTITQGDAESLSIEAEDNILPLVETTVEKGALRIGLKGDISPTKPIKIKLGVKTLNAVVLSGSGKIRTEKLTASGALEVKLAGSGLIDLKGVACDTWNLSVSGSGDVKAAGHAKEQKVLIAGSGDYEGFRLETGTAEVTVNGSGDSEINATDKLLASISGSGDIDYTGSAKVTKKVTGSGGVTQVAPPK